MCVVPADPDEHGFFVGQVIARPFLDEPGRLRTVRRRFSVLPHGETLLDAKGNVHAIVNQRYLAGGASAAVARRRATRMVWSLCGKPWTNPGWLIFANLIDFDAVWAPNDPQGYARAYRNLMVSCLNYCKPLLRGY